VDVSDYPDTPKDYIVASYRYLRLAMVILVVTLAVSLVIEISRASCWQGSISAYFYTPVHAVFVGALVAIGVVLVALKGRESVEDLCFNLAGVLAPVVALVPTSRPENVCSRPGDELTVRTSTLVTNNVPALLVGAALAIGIAYAIAKKQGKVELRKPPRATIVGIVLSVVLLAAGLGWYLADFESFEERAHGAAAIAMFVAIWCAVMVNAGWPRRVLVWLYGALDEKIPPVDATPRHLRYRSWYRGVSLFMIAAALGALLSLLADWDQRVFWLEAAEIAPFAVFWALQTFEAWEFGVTAPPAGAKTSTSTTPARP
jgi:hypothetical protein